MAITRATDLTVAKSDGTAETIAAACWDFANGLDVGTASDASRVRQLRRHAHELLELHSIPAAEILVAHVAAVPENGRVEPDHEMLRNLRAEG